MAELHLGTVNDEPFCLPLDALTAMIAIVGRRGSGKTTTALALAEEFIKAGLPVVLLDPLGVHWGLRSSADGEHPGLPVTILGGAHGDLPLEETAGHLVAELVVEQPGAYIIDLSSFESRSAEKRFSADFAERLYRVKAHHNDALGLIVDEADTFAPQNAKGEERMLGAFEAIARRGRVRGLGMVPITQRPAVLNKNVLSQCEVMIAHQVTAPQDRDALQKWAEGNATPDQVKVFIDSLASLGVGQAWLWSPAWLGVFQRIDVRRRETYDSSATPKAGEMKVEPRVLADIDLEALRRRMAETLERAEAEDPKALRKRIAVLEKQIAAGQPPACNHEVVISALRADLEGERNEYNRVYETFLANRQRLHDEVSELIYGLSFVQEETDANPRPGGLRGDGRDQEADRGAGRAGAEPAARGPRADRRPHDSGDNGAGGRLREVPALARPGGLGASEGGAAAARGAGAGEAVSGPEQRVLDAIAWLNSIGIEAPAQLAVAFLAGYSWGGGYFKPRGSLKTRGLVEYVTGDLIRLTDEGRALARTPDEQLTTTELHRAVLARLPGPESRVLGPLLDAWPDAVSHEVLAPAAGYSLGGGYFKPRGRLKTLGLVEYVSGGVRASDILFPEGTKP